MKSKSKHSVFFKAIVLTMAFALTVLCFPMNALMAFAAGPTDPQPVDNYHILTIDKNTRNENPTKVNVGDEFYIPDAYISGDEDWKIGDSNIKTKVLQKGTEVSAEDENGDGIADTPTVTLDSSNVTVRHYGQIITSSDDTASNKEETKREAYQGKFVADYVGTYVITYSYTYTESYKRSSGEALTKTYTNSHELNVTSTMSKASINFDYDNVSLVPTEETNVIDFSLEKGKYEDGARKGELKDIKILLPKILDENGNEIGKDDNLVTIAKNSKPSDEDFADEKPEKVLVISAYGGAAAKDVKIEKENDEFCIKSNDVFPHSEYGDGNYTLKFDYYVRTEKNGVVSYHFVTSNTKSFTVYGSSQDSKNKHFDKYELDISLDSEWLNNGETGVEHSLPKAIGLTTDDSKPSEERVNVAYRVRVFYKQKFEDKYEEISKIKVSGSDELLYKDVLELDEKYKNDSFVYGTLADATKFKPLQDGFYSFVYTIRDFYGFEKSNGQTAYEYYGEVKDGVRQGITDKTKPTPIVYDASVTDKYEDIKDETYKSRTYASANSVVVYAIGMTDNHSTHTEGEMSRRVTFDGVHQFTIDDYDEFNLVFNYRGFEGLRHNNFNIEKEVRKFDGKENEIKSDVDMINWLAKAGKYAESSNGGYKIVVDKANYADIYKIFNAVKGTEGSNSNNEKNLFDGLTFNGAPITEDNFCEWVKTKAGADAGFAYLDLDKTFGLYDGKAKDQTKGFGLGTFKIEYIVKDAAKNEASKEVNITIVDDEVDDEKPTISFKSSLKSAYLPNDVVTFDAPTSTDTRDNKLHEVVLYRYLDENKQAISLYEADEKGNKTEKTRSQVNLTELWKDLSDEWDNNNVELKAKYEKYHSGDNDGYFDITDEKASTYEIDLSELDKLIVDGSKNAKQIQIVTYVYDDQGNATMYGETADITTLVDEYAPILADAKTDDNTYYQGDEIKLNDIVFNDDAVKFMKYEVKVTYRNGDTVSDVPVSGDSQESDGLYLTYTVHPGTFVAEFAGEYQVAIKVSDGKENTIVYFQRFNVLQRDFIVEPTQIKSTLQKNQTIELEGDDNYDPSKGIEIPVPEIPYTIPNSITYEEYAAISDKSAYASTSENKYVIWGLKENGTVENYAYSVSVPLNDKGGFSPVATKQDYEIKYTVRVRIYDFRAFTMNDKPTFNGSEVTEGGVLTYQKGGTNAKNAKVRFLENNKFEVEASDKKYYLIIDGTGVKVFSNEQCTQEQVLSGTMFEEAGVMDDFRTLRNYVLSSDVYRVKVVDNKAPELNKEFYDSVYKPIPVEEKLEEIDIYGFKFHENKAGIDDIDYDKSKIVVYYTLPNGRESGREEYDKSKGAFQDVIKYKLPTTKHATITIRYNAYDKNGNDSSYTKTVTVGDMNAPEFVDWPEDIIKETYEIGELDTLTIDLTKFKFNDAGVNEYNKEAEEKNEPLFEYSPTAKLVITSSNNEEVAPSRSEGFVYEFPIDKIGKYRLTIEVKDYAGNTASLPLDFEVVSKTADTTMTYQVIGTILIVISVLVLAGVIIYFIVSKVKLDKELKK